MTLLKSFLTGFILFSCLWWCSGQIVIIRHDTASLKNEPTLAIAEYVNVMGKQSFLYNGREYKSPSGTSEANDQHPYFASEYLETGDIVYDHQLYNKVPLLYNLVTDDVIIEHNDQQGFYGLVKLNPDLVKYFVVGGHTYYRIQEDSIHNLKTGFYDQLSDGKIGLLARKWKVFHQDISNRQVSVVYKEKINYYLKKNDQYFLVRSKSSLLRLLDDQKKILRPYANKNRLNFLNDKEKAFTALVTYYNMLTQ